MTYFQLTYRIAGGTFARLAMVGQLEEEVAWLLSIGALSIEVGALVTY
jgi:hypothetical protein